MSHFIQKITFTIYKLGNLTETLIHDILKIRRNSLFANHDLFLKIFPMIPYSIQIFAEKRDLRPSLLFTLFGHHFFYLHMLGITFYLHFYIFSFFSRLSLSCHSPFDYFEIVPI